MTATGGVPAGASASAVLAALAVLLGAARLPQMPMRLPPPLPRTDARPGSAHAPGRRTARASTVLAGLVAVLAAGLISPVAAVTVAAGWAVSGRVAERRRRRRRRRLAEAALPDALDLFAVSLGGGMRPAECFEVLASLVPPVLAGPWAGVVDRLRRGHRFADAVAPLGDELGPDALAFASTLALTDAAGLAVAPAVERLADDARQQRRRAAEAAARELPVRLAFPLVLCTLPAFVLVAIVPLLLGAVSSLRAT